MSLNESGRYDSDFRASKRHRYLALLSFLLLPVIGFAQGLSRTFNSSGGLTNLGVNPRAPKPSVVYVDSSYVANIAPVTFPNVGGTGTYHVGYDAFSTIQAAIDAVAAGGTINVAAGTYVENVTVSQAITILGPNAGLAGTDPRRGAEAVLIPDVNDPENTPILSAEASGVIIDGLLFDGHNPAFRAGTYDANGISVSAAAALQNGIFGFPVNVDHLTVQNCVMRNISYAGIYLELPLGMVNGFDYIRNNLFENMWEGLQTYAVHSVVTDNTFTNLNRGLSVHGTTAPASPGFVPVISNNVLTVAQWWPTTDLPSRVRAQGIWVNYRRLNAAPLQVVHNIINTPVPAPIGKTLRALQALTVDGNVSLTFIGNVVNGMGNCNQGFYASYCQSNNAVQLVGGSLNNIRDHGVLAQTLDPDWGAGNALVTISNVSITMSAGGTGVMAAQDPTTPSNRAQVTVIGGTRISGGTTGIQVTGTNAAATVKGASISGAGIGVDVNSGRALLEHNQLSGNAAAGIELESGSGIIDAGDCLGGNITGLGTGSGANGSSAGLNDLSGYGFGSSPPWAVKNLRNVMLPAFQNDFGALLGDSIAANVSGPVNFSQAGGTLLSCPATVFVECAGDIPAGMSSLAAFNALGGVVSANQGTLAYADNPANPVPDDQIVVRTYTFTDICGNVASCQQDIVVHDLTPPDVVCPSTMVRGVNAGQHFASVTFSVSASDNCGLASVTASPPSGFNFPAGANSVLVTAIDINNNTNTSAFTVLVVDRPIITSAPLSVTNLAGSTLHFSVLATSPTPMNYQWKKGGTPLRNSGNISGATSPNLTLANISSSDAATYSVDVSNLAGATTSSATLTIAIRPTLLLVGYSGGKSTLSLAGTPGLQYAVQASTDFVHWSGLCTNSAPYIFQDVSPLAFRFYRGVLNP